MDRSNGSKTDAPQWDYEGLSDRHFPVAVVGLGCRFPGNVRTTADFERVMQDGTYVVGDIPADRWDLDRYWHPDPHHVGTHCNKKLGTLENVHDFDHTFFNVSPREAGNMDVQHRHLMECTQEALDDAGIPSESLPKDTGVYVGVGLMDHGFTVIEEQKCINAYTHTGTAHSVAANRICYHYDIRGPSVAIDTACAASLTAMHYACFALWNKECPVAIVGGVNTIIVPEVTVGFSALGVLASNGISCPFSADATGYVRSEGVGATILKPLDQAMKDGDNVYCVIKGTWLAHNGYSLSITMPSTDAQAELMQKTYDVFGLNKNNVDFVEAHGTGTPVGDPIEAEAIAKAFCIDNPERKKPLAVGSSKSHFGHLECAAGMAQLLKVALMLKNRVVYPNIHFREPNPAIDMDAWNLYVPEELVPFTEDKTYTIGVNTFGFGGALAHMVFQEFHTPKGYEDHLPGQAGWKVGSGAEKGLKILIPLSAKSGAALKATAKVWQEYEREEDAQEIFCWLASRRSHYGNRCLIMADSGEDFRNKLQMYQDKVSHEEIIEVQVPLHNEKKSICFVFPGQGQQSFEMGRSLYRDEPVFRKAIDDCDAIYEKVAGKSFLKTYNMFIALEEGKEYNKDSANEILISQPAILFLQIGLLHLVEHWGIKADCVVGHSLGEVAAAYAAGTVSLEGAITVQYYRATQQERLAGTGSMAALRVSAEEGQELCNKTSDLYVACVNAHRSVTMAGGKQVIKDLCAANPNNAKELRVLCAFHTPHMDPIGDDFLRLMEGKLESQRPHRYAMYSTVTGTGQKHDDITDSKYFWDNIRGTVHFLEAVQGIMRDYENVVFLELAGSATLLSSIRAIAKEEEFTPAGMMSCGQRGRDDRISTLRALSTVYGLGIDVDWANVHGNCGHWMQLPKYAWQHQTFRYEAEKMRSRRIDIEDRTLRGYGGTLMLENQNEFRDYHIDGELYFPKSGYLEYVFEMQFEEEAYPVLRNISFKPEHLQVPEDFDHNGEVPPRITLRQTKEHIKDGKKVTVTCDGTTYATAEIHNQEPIPEQCKIDISRIKTRCKDVVSHEEFYAKFLEMGVEYEDELKFRNVTEAYIGDGEALAHLHPFVDKHMRLNVMSLDAACTVAMAALKSNKTLLTVTKMDSLRMHVPKLPMKIPLMAHAKLTSAGAWGITADVVITDEEGNVLVSVTGLTAENLTGVSTATNLDSCLYTTEYQPVDSCMPPTSSVVEFFKEQNLKKLYPDEMEKIQNSEKYSAQLKELCAAYAKHAVTAVTESEINPKNERYYKRLVQMAKNIPTKHKFEDLPAVVDNLIEKSPESFQEYDMVRRMGEILPESLKDPKAALSELFQEDMMKAYFLDSISTRIYYKTIADNVRRACLEAKKMKQLVRVLEVGGRLGGLSEYILTAIEDLLQDGSVEFTFTDINIAFFHMVEERLQRFPNVKYQQLDIERDVVTQSFTPNAYDLVVCLDTLHCTRDSVESTSIMRDLLCKDGWVIVMESTNNQNTPEIIFGAFELCWIYDDQRKERCWLGQKGWKDVLQKSGFSDVVAASTPKEFYHSLIVGRKTNLHLMYPEIQAKEKEEVIQQPQEKPQWVLVHMDDTALASAVKSSWKRYSLENVLSNTPKSPRIVNVEEFDQMVDSLTSYDGILNIALFWNEKDSDMAETLKVFRVCQELGERPQSNLWVITQEGTMQCNSIESSIAVGFLRSATSALSNMNGYIIDVEKLPVKDQAAGIVSVFESHTHNNTEISVYNKTHYVRRIIKRPQMTEAEKGTACDWRIEASAKGDHYDGLELHQVRDKAVKDNEVCVRVEAVGISTEEIQDIVSEDRVQALQPGKVCAGTITQCGSEAKDFKVTDQVIAFADGCLSSVKNINTEYIFKRPHNVSVADCAASVTAYVQAYHALMNRAHLSSEDIILIMGASENVGMAAIELAKHLKAKQIICAVDSDAKKAFIQKHCNVENVIEISDSFIQDVKRMTGGQGVNCALNATNCHKQMVMSLRCMAEDGHYCQVSSDKFIESPVAMEALANNSSLHTINFGTLSKTAKFRGIVNSVITMLEKGQVSPIANSIQQVEEFKQVFTNLKEGGTVAGSLVFDVPRSFNPEVMEPARQVFDSDAVYIVTGATGGIGNEFIHWMAQRGARHLISISSQGCHTWFHSNTLNNIQELGANVIDVKADLCDEAVVRETLTHLFKNQHPPIKGFFHLAGAFDEGTLEDMSEESVKRAVQTKVTSARIISGILAEMPEVELDHFVMMSSSKVTWGAPTLAAFCAAANGLDALAIQRKQQGLPALSIQSGWIRGAGLLEDRERSEGIAQYTKNASLHISEFLAILGKIINKDLPPVVAVTNEDWDIAMENTNNKLCVHHLATVGGKKNAGTDLSADDLQNKMADKLGNLLMMSPDDIDVQQPMVLYGVDSLISLDVTNWLRKEFNIIINQMDILEGMTTATVIEKILE